MSSPLTASGFLAGLGEGDVDVILEASGIGTAMCKNKGGNLAPGQNPIEVNVMGLQSIPETLIKNGTAPFSVTVDDPPLPTATEGGCPNGNWKVVDLFVSWTSATITVKVAGTEAVLLQQDYKCVTTSTSGTCTAVP